MPDRLSAMDASFVQLELREQPMHVGSVMIFEAPENGLDYSEFLAHLRARIALVPRFRCRIRNVPGGLGTPVWVDDEKFDLSYHVRRSALPRPGSMDQLNELVGRVVARRLDLQRPLWELYVVEGLADNQIALIAKTHPAMIDGVRAIDLAQVVLDAEQRTATAPTDTWQPGREPGALELLAGAVTDSLRRPSSLVTTVRSGLAQLPMARLASQATAVVASATKLAPASPLNHTTACAHRRFATAECSLAHLRDMRDRVSRRLPQNPSPEVSEVDRITINDVVLGCITGAFRHWLLLRGWPMQTTTTLRALLPVSVGLVHESDRRHALTDIAPQLVDLPVGEPNPILRVHQIAYQLASATTSDQAVSARALTRLRGFAPATIHALGLRVAHGLSNRVFNVMITNVPGPQQALYARRMKMLATYPVLPTMTHHALALGVTSYQGQVFFGVNADRDAIADLNDFVSCLGEAIEELQGSASA